MVEKEGTFFPWAKSRAPGKAVGRRLCFLLLGALFGCAGRQPAIPPDLPRVADAQGLTVRHLATPPFVLKALAPGAPAGPVLRVYIEGDGRAWLTRGRLSPDPTPSNSLVPALLEADPAPDKAYLARPCQYLRKEGCNPVYWSDRRFSPEVVASMDEALNQLKRAGGYQALELVGYSGGGTMAALLAARRSDVLFLRTIAGNLDHGWLNRHHRLSPLAGSLNPPDFAARLASVPQRHFFGAADRLVPPEVYQAYRGVFRDTGCLAVTVIPGADHVSGWRENWPELLALAPGCAPQSPALPAPLHPQSARGVK